MTAETVHAHAFPCCAAGGACCNPSTKGCCSWVPLKRYFLEHGARNGSADGNGVPQLQARVPYTPHGALQSRDPLFRFMPAEQLAGLQRAEAAYWERDASK